MIFQRLNIHPIRATLQVWPGFLLLGLFLFTAGALHAQEPAGLKDIRARYQAVNERIARCTGPEDPCGYYVNTVEVNRKQDPWAAVGIYHIVQDFWYTGGYSPDGMAYDLHKINTRTARSSRQEHEEYLFDKDGKLIFYYFQLGESEAVGQEIRFYFAEEKLIHYKEKVSPEEREYQRWKKEDAADILKEAQRMHELFLHTLGEN